MFLRKGTVILLPLGLLGIIALLLPLLVGMDVFFGSLLLPLAGATRLREPFAWLLWVPAAVVLLILLYQYLASLGTEIPLLRLLATDDARLITVEGAFAAYMITFSVRTGRGI